MRERDRDRDRETEREKEREKHFVPQKNSHCLLFGYFFVLLGIESSASSDC
jgi:hypothetical protein